MRLHEESLLRGLPPLWMIDCLLEAAAEDGKNWVSELGKEQCLKLIGEWVAHEFSGRAGWY